MTWAAARPRPVPLAWLVTALLLGGLVGVGFVLFTGGVLVGQLLGFFLGWVLG